MDIYRNISLSTLKRTGGNQREADYWVDKPFWHYYWDLENYNDYIKDMEAKRKEQSNQPK